MVSRVGHVRADPSSDAPGLARRPSLWPGSPHRRALSPASILALQRSAGNRAVRRRLQRKVTGDVLGGSVGVQFAEELTPDEMRQQVALLVHALDTQKLDRTTREVLQQNLHELEEYAADAQIGVPASTGYHLRQVIKALSSDVTVMATEAKGLGSVGSFGDRVVAELGWDIHWLERVSDAIAAAAGKVVSAEKGSSNSAAEFAAAAKLLSGAIPMSKAIAAHMAYLTVVKKVEEQYPNAWSSMMYTKLEVVRDTFTSLMVTIWSGRDPPRFDKDVAKLLEEVPSLSSDFSAFVYDLEEKMRKRHRFLQWVGIFELGLLAFDIWLAPVVGRPGGGGKPPTIGGAGGGGAAVAGGGVLVAAESVEALRRLVRLGVVTNPGLVKVVTGGGGGRGPVAPPKPMHTDPTPDPGKRGRAPDKPAGKGTPAGADPDPRPAPGLPSASEDVLLREYTQGLKNLREKRAAFDAVQKDPKKTSADRIKARQNYENAKTRLADIEAQAVRQGGEAVQHLDPLTRERTILERGVEGTTTGIKVTADVVRIAPKNLRYKDFAEIEAALGHRKPDVVDPAYKPPGGGVATAHQRLIWKLKDGSMLIADKPGPRPAGSTRPTSADLPHVELHGPKASASTHRE